MFVLPLHSYSQHTPFKALELACRKGRDETGFPPILIGSPAPSSGEGGLQGKWRDQTPRPEVVITGGLS
jgi:hypothetical protein